VLRVNEGECVADIDAISIVRAHEAAGSSNVVVSSDVEQASVDFELTAVIVKARGDSNHPVTPSIVDIEVCLKASVAPREVVCLWH
jgi:hypothetical protein